jgi:hypothetical protein
VQLEGLGQLKNPVTSSSSLEDNVLTSYTTTACPLGEGNSYAKILRVTEQRTSITLMRLACSSGFHLPKTFNLKEDLCNYGNNSKERIMVLLGWHAGGTDRLPELVTGKMKIFIA